MRVALIAEHVHPSRGGAETSTLQFALHLQTLGVEPTLLTRSEVSAGNGLHVMRIDPPRTARAFRSIAFSDAVDKLVPKQQFDLIHALTPSRWANLYQPRGGSMPETMLRNKLLRRTSGRMFRDLVERFNLKQRRLLAREKALVEGNPDLVVIAISDYVARQFREHYNLTPTRIRKIFNGVDYTPLPEQRRQIEREQIRRRYGIGEDEVLALLVAHNFKLKGINRWIEALAHLKGASPSIRSVVAGKGNSRPYEQLARRLGVGDRITFIGASRKISGLFHGTDICIHPTYYDPCSRVVLEAMLSGTPCVTTRFNGACEIIEDGVTGRIISSPDEISALADAAREISTPSFRNALHERHHQLAERLSMKRHTKQVVELYRSLLETAAVK